MALADPGESGHVPHPVRQSDHKISKTAATRCQLLMLKCTKFDFRPRCGSLQRSPCPLAVFKGHTSKGMEGREGEGKGHGKGRGR